MISLAVFFFLVDYLATACRLDVVLNVDIVDQIEEHRVILKCDTLSHLRLVPFFVSFLLCSNDMVRRDDEFVHVILRLLSAGQTLHGLLFFLRVTCILVGFLEIGLHGFLLEF